MNKPMKLLSGLVLTMLLGMTSTTTITPVHADTPTFQDIEQSFAKQDIQALAARHVVNGYQDGTFQPKAPVTRAEFATLLLKAKGLPPVDPYAGIFRDVQRGEWFTPYVELSYRLGVTSGTSDQSFRPNANLTREEMVQMTVSALGPAAETARNLSYATQASQLSPFADQSQVDGWARKAMAYAVQQGMLHGNSDNQLQPHALATREEVAAFLENAFPHAPAAARSIGAGVDLPYQSVHHVLTTAYDYSGQNGFTGLTEREGMVAVDPNVIPLGSHLYVPGYGYAVAADTGGLIKGERIDLFFFHQQQAIDYGAQHGNVYILD